MRSVGFTFTWDEEDFPERDAVTLGDALRLIDEGKVGVLYAEWDEEGVAADTTPNHWKTLYHKEV